MASRLRDARRVNGSFRHSHSSSQSSSPGISKSDVQVPSILGWIPAWRPRPSTFQVRRPKRKRLRSWFEAGVGPLRAAAAPSQSRRRHRPPWRHRRLAGRARCTVGFRQGLRRERARRGNSARRSSFLPLRLQDRRRASGRPCSRRRSEPQCWVPAAPDVSLRRGLGRRGL